MNLLLYVLFVVIRSLFASKRGFLEIILLKGYVYSHKPGIKYNHTQRNEGF
jgi:hypothetical protein